MTIFRLSIIKNPAGTYSYVGSVPASLGNEVKATSNDVMAGRSYRNPAGEIVTLKFPVFQTEADPREFAHSKGCTVVGDHPGIDDDSNA